MALAPEALILHILRKLPEAAQACSATVVNHALLEHFASQRAVPTSHPDLPVTLDTAAAVPTAP